MFGHAQLLILCVHFVGIVALAESVLERVSRKSADTPEACALISISMREPSSRIVLVLDCGDRNPTFENAGRVRERLERIASLRKHDAASQIVLNALEKEKPDDSGSRYCSRRIYSEQSTGQIENLTCYAERLSQLLVEQCDCIRFKLVNRFFCHSPTPILRRCTAHQPLRGTGSSLSEFGQGRTPPTHTAPLQRASGYWNALLVFRSHVPKLDVAGSTPVARSLVYVPNAAVDPSSAPRSRPVLSCHQGSTRVHACSERSTLARRFRLPAACQ